MRAERDDQLEHITREFGSDLVNNHDDLTDETKIYPDVEQAPLFSKDVLESKDTHEMVEHSSDAGDIHEPTDGRAEDGMAGSVLPLISETPAASVEADLTDDEGYEWYTKEDGVHFYREAESGDNWTRYDP